jgi:hypothetical protein
VFGWLDTRLVFGNQAISRVVRIGVLIGTLAMLVLTLARMKQVVSKLFGLWVRGRGRPAWRVAVSNPVINSLWLFSVFMFCLRIRLDNRFGAQGRNWLPFIMPIFLVSIHYAPKVLTKQRNRKLLSCGVLISLACYSLVGNYCAVQSIQQRYYDANNDQPMVQRSVAVEYFCQTEGVKETAGTGDSFFGFAMKEPEFVYAVRFRYVLANWSGEKVHFRYVWSNGTEEPARCTQHELEMDYLGQTGEKTLYVWVNDTIDRLGTRLDDAADGFEVREIILYQRPASEAASSERVREQNCTSAIQ